MSKKVALMCGHGRSTDGSWDPGTAYGGNNEAALMLPITKAAVKYLRSYGVTVISDADTNNNKNMIADVAWSNKQKCDIYISVHCDYYKAPSGVMPLYVSAKGKKLATALNTAVKKSLGMKSRGVVKRTDLYELNVTDCPACILETGSIKADISILKKKPDTYGKAIAKGICDYLGVKAEPKQTTTPTKTETKKVETKKTETIYRVRKSWKDPKTQVGAYKSLDNAIAECNKHVGYSVYSPTGKVLHKSTKKAAPKTKEDKIIDGCIAQAKNMKNFTYGWEKNPTKESTKKKGTCVSYEGVALQIAGFVKEGKYMWHNGKGYGTGKVYGDTRNFDIIYMNNKTFSELKKKLKRADVVFCDDNKSGKEGSGGHVMIFSGEFDKDGNPLVYDQNSAAYYKDGKEDIRRVYSKSHKILAIARVK